MTKNDINIWILRNMSTITVGISFKNPLNLLGYYYHENEWKINKTSQKNYTSPLCSEVPYLIKNLCTGLGLISILFNVEFNIPSFVLPWHSKLYITYCNNSYYIIIMFLCFTSTTCRAYLWTGILSFILIYLWHLAKRGHSSR